MFGATKKCEHCGCSFGMFDSDIWAYRRMMRMPEDVRQRQHWFCSWNCLVQAQKEADVYFGAIREEQMERARQRMRRNSAERRARKKEQRTT